MKVKMFLKIKVHSDLQTELGQPSILQFSPAAIPDSLNVLPVPCKTSPSDVCFYHFVSLVFAFLVTDLKYENILKKLSSFPENILSTSLHTACMWAKRQGECSLNCYKHCRSFPIRDRVSYHLEAVVVVLMDDLFIPTGKSQISVVTLGFVTKV